MSFVIFALVVCLAPPLPGATYNPVGKRDPFKPVCKPEKVRKLGPLEKFELDRLRLVAVIDGTSQPLAMVESPDGVQYVVLIGTPIGRNQGRVSRITKGRVVISEKIFNTTERRLVKHQAELKIEKDSKSLDPGKRDEAHPWATLWRRRPD
jgi:type IV pilus assembly protein PilP